MANLPSGTVTFLFTDIEGSTAMWERDRAAMRESVNRHLTILSSLIEAHHGVLYKTVGDGTQSAFASSENALRGAVAIQRALLAEAWADPPGPVRVRMALHAGEAVPDDHGDYLAAPLNRLSRLLAIGHGGQILLSQAVQQLSRGGLPPGAELRDLGEHRLRDLLEPERVFQLLHPELLQDFPPLKSLEARLHNLPRQPTPFLGREMQVQEIATLLRREDVQLLTLTGPGGTGKTRLALQAATELLDAFADGVYFVPLAPLTDPARVPDAVALALGLHDEGNQPLLDRLMRYLSAKELLLVIDNLEHLIESAPTVGSLLTDAPQLKVLVTSRVPLRLRAEREYPVPPLALPKRKPPPTLEQLSQYDAVRLFIERAQAVRPDFAVDNQSAPAVAEICHRLDGLPLAIELAAARVRMLPPSALLTRLEKCLPLLTSGARDAPARQRTLRDTITWSYDLLDSAEQHLFRRLAVFAGGCTLDSADAVGNPDGEIDAFVVLEGLVEHSLLRQVVDSGGEPRFFMLETIREFAHELLTATGEEPDLRQRHAQHFLTLAESAYEHRYGRDQATWFDRLEADQANFGSALTWAHDAGESELLLLLAGNLGDFWSVRAHHQEGTQWLTIALAGNGSPASRFRALLHASGLAYQQGRNRRSTELAEEALALAQESGTARNIASAQGSLGHALYIEGNLDRAEHLLTEALRGYRDEHYESGAASVLVTLAQLALDQGHLDQVGTYIEEALPTFQAEGEADAIAFCLFLMSFVATSRGDGDHAIALLEEASAMWEEGHYPFMLGLARTHLAGLLLEHRGDDAQAEALFQDVRIAWQHAGNADIEADVLIDLAHIARRRGDLTLAQATLEEARSLVQKLADPIEITNRDVRAVVGLGLVARAQSDIPQALSHFREALLRLQRALSEHPAMLGPLGIRLNSRVADCLEATAYTVGAAGKAAEAARLLGTATELRSAGATPMLKAELARAEQEMAPIRAQLSDTTFAMAEASGRALSTQDALTEALALIDEVSTTPT